MSLISKLGKRLSSEDKYISIISILKEYPLKSHRGIWGVRRYVMPLSSAFSTPLITEEFDYGSSVSPPPRCQETSCMQSHLWSFPTRRGLLFRVELVTALLSNNIKILRLIPSKLTLRKKKKKERFQKWRLRMLFQIKKNYCCDFWLSLQVPAEIICCTFKPDENPVCLC